VNTANILNYRSDSSEDNEVQDSDSEGYTSKFPMPRKMAEVSSNTAWGSKKKSFYNKADAGSSSEDDSDASEDMQVEADRLAKIRSSKIAR